MEAPSFESQRAVLIKYTLATPAIEFLKQAKSLQDLSIKSKNKLVVPSPEKTRIDSCLKGL